MHTHHHHHEAASLPASILSAAVGETSQSVPVVQVVLNFPPVVGYEGLGQLLNKTVQTLQADRSRNPDSVPPASTPPGSRTPLWIVADVIAWLQQHKDQPATRRAPKRKAGPGASTKPERLAAQAAGLTVTEWRAQQAQGGAA